jgi:hypothetical protein
VSEGWLNPSFALQDGRQIVNRMWLNVWICSGGLMLTCCMPRPLVLCFSHNAFLITGKVLASNIFPIMIVSIRWEYVCKLRLPMDLLFSPRWYMSIESHDGIISTKENSSFIYQRPLAVLPAESSRRKAGGTG